MRWGRYGGYDDRRFYGIWWRRPRPLMEDLWVLLSIPVLWAVIEGGYLAVRFLIHL